MEQNIIAWYNRADQTEISEGSRWYWTANRFVRKIARRYGRSVMEVAGITAAMSAQKSWEMNMEIVDLYYRGIYKHTSVVIRKCDRIREARSYLEIKGILNGLKTMNFFDAILHPNNPYSMTIDRHMIKVATGEHWHTCTDRQYREISRAYKNVARYLNVSPNVVQCVCWLSWRKVNKNKQAEQHNNHNMTIEEIIDTVDALNDKMPDREMNGYFYNWSMVYHGFYASILINDTRIWSQEDDDRDFDEDQNEYEDLVSYCLKEARKYVEGLYENILDMRYVQFQREFEIEEIWEFPKSMDDTTIISYWNAWKDDGEGCTFSDYMETNYPSIVARRFWIDELDV